MIKLFQVAYHTVTRACVLCPLVARHRHSQLWAVQWTKEEVDWACYDMIGSSWLGSPRCRDAINVEKSETTPMEVLALRLCWSRHHCFLTSNHPLASITTNVKVIDLNNLDLPIVHHGRKTQNVLRVES